MTLGIERDAHGRTVLVGVYFIREAGGTAVKIGFSGVDPLQRLSDLQRGNPRELEILACLPGATRTTEREWHVRYAADRLVGEWFALSEALNAEIAAKGVMGADLLRYMEHPLRRNTAIQAIRRWMTEAGVTEADIAKAGQFPRSRITRLLAGLNRHGVSLPMARLLCAMANGALDIDVIRPGTTKRLADNARLRAKRQLLKAKRQIAALEKVAA